MAKRLTSCCGSTSHYDEGIQEHVCDVCGEWIPTYQSPSAGTHVRFFRGLNALLKVAWTEPKGILVDVQMEVLDGPAPSILLVCDLFDAALRAEVGNGFADFPMHEEDLECNNMSTTSGMSGRLDYWGKRPKFEAFGKVFNGGHTHILHKSMEGKINQGLAAHGEHACNWLLIALAIEATKAKENGPYSTAKVVEIFPEQ